MARLNGLVIVLVGLLACRTALSSDVERQLADALTELTYVNFEGAYALYESAAQAAPEGSELWQQAVFGQAVCAQQILPAKPANLQEARRLYQLLLDKVPDSPLAPRAMLSLGRLIELRYPGEEADLPAARQWYQKILDGLPDDPLVAEATLRLAATFIQTYEREPVERGIEILRAFLAKHPDDFLATAMWQYMGDAYYFPLKDYAKAVECYERCDALGWADTAHLTPMYWRTAILADKHLKNRALAVKYYTKLIKEAYTGGKAYESQLALRRLGAPVPPMPLQTHQPEEQRLVDTSD